MSENVVEKHLSATRSLCPECDRVTDAEIFERGGRVLMRKNCPEHGGFELEMFDDAAFYGRCAAGTSAVDAGLLECGVTGCLDCERHMGKVKTLMIDVTERCNLDCAACFTNTHSRKSREPSAGEIRARLEKWATRPTVLLCGGEPTLRDDLPEVIRTITSLGFVVKMASNGIRLRDRAYVEELKSAGLDWVLFQFDGFSDEIYRRMRGRDLLEVKNEALWALGESGVKICLACMVVKGLNDGELGKIVEFMMANDHIMHLGCTVLSCVGRQGFGEEHKTSALDVMRAIERGTGGKVSVEDFMSARRIGDRFFRLTGNLNFQQKSCFHTLMLHSRGDGYFPVNRYFRPLTALRNAGGFAELALLFGRLKDWDAISLTGRAKLITVEEFRPHDSIDLLDANRCNKVYMAENGYIPPCIYNTKYRPLCWEEKDRLQATGHRLQEKTEKDTNHESQTTNHESRNTKHGGI